jgi:hypothetical protein
MGASTAIIASAPRTTPQLRVIPITSTTPASAPTDHPANAPRHPTNRTRNKPSSVHEPQPHFVGSGHRRQFLARRFSLGLDTENFGFSQITPLTTSPTVTPKCEAAAEFYGCRHDTLRSSVLADTCNSRAAAVILPCQRASSSHQTQARRHGL